MNKLIITIVVLHFTLLCVAQEYPFFVKVVDIQNELPIEKASVMIKELAETNSSDSKGRVAFDNVPVGGIYIEISKQGYLTVSRTFNITSQTKDNSLIVKLRKRESEIIAISGEVTDGYGKGVPNAKIELRGERQLIENYTDNSGYYFAEFNLSDLRYGTSALRLRLEKDECEQRDEIVIPKTSKQIIKNIKLACGSEKPDDKYPDPSNRSYDWTGKWLTESKAGGWSNIDLVVKKVNDHYVGIYSNGAGYLTFTSSRGNDVFGHWSYSVNGKIADSGRVIFKLSDDGKSFSGYFNSFVGQYKTETDWSGIRIE